MPDDSKGPEPQPNEPKPEKRPLDFTDLARQIRENEKLQQSVLASVRLQESLVGGVGASLASVLGHTAFRSAREEQLEKEIAALRRQVSDQTKALDDARRDGKNAADKINELKTTHGDLVAKQTLRSALARIASDAREVLLQSEAFQKELTPGRRCDAFVMSVDLRRSTDLMLKARSPEDFAEFITALCDGLCNTILRNHGVFEKFTGDGILAFFPDFYTGEDAGYYAISAASQCHEQFAKHYSMSRRYFTAIPRDAGLGIGIDYGWTGLVRVGEDLAIVGAPVVYACRLGGAPSGVTLLNQPAYEKIFERFSAYAAFSETEIEMKHEGSFLAYSVTLNGKPCAAKDPAWFGYRKSQVEAAEG